MNWKKKWLLSVLALALVGCPEQEAQVLWAQGVIQQDDSCEWLPILGSGAKLVPKGVLDLSVAREGYFAGVQLINGLPRSQEVSGLGPAQAYLENNFLHILGSTVNYDSNGLSITLPQGFFQYSPSAAMPGEPAISVINVVPPSVLSILRNEPWLVQNKVMNNPLLAACFEQVTGENSEWRELPIGGRRAEILIRLKFEGYLQDGTEVISNELRFPLEICNGCLVAPQPQMHAADIARSILDAEGSFCTGQGIKVSCTTGQDNCVDVRKCFNENFLAEGEVVDILKQCASDPTFPPENVSTTTPSIYGVLLPPAYTPGDSSYLEQLYSFERVNAYCRLQAEAPLFPTQPGL
jgi:hypothetical protein